MYKDKKSKNKRNYKKLVLLLLVLMLTVAGGVRYELHKDIGAPPQNTKVTESNSEVNYSPPTEEEQKSGDKRKREIVGSMSAPENTSDRDETTPEAKNKKVSVIITDASQYNDIIEVRSFIPDHYQDGTCKIAFTKDSLTLSKETPAYKDISTTICTNPEFKTSEFKTKGTWIVTVSYESANASGKSDAREVTIK